MTKATEKGSEILDEVKAAAKAKAAAAKAENAKVYTRTEIALGITKFVVYVAIGVLVGVYGSNMINSTIKHEVSAQVQSLSKVSQ